MTLDTGADTDLEPTGRAARALSRRSRRPSRLGTAAGVAPGPDRERDTEGFPDLLRRVWRAAVAATDLDTTIEVLLTLDGYVPADVQLRALRRDDEVALAVLTGRTWRPATGVHGGTAPPGTRHVAGEGTGHGTRPPFLGELGLTTSGRLVLRTPSQRPLGGTHDLVDGVVRVPWAPSQLAAYQEAVERARARAAAATADSRRWLADAGPAGRADLLEMLSEAALRTAPFVLYQDGQQYTNFRDLNTLTGKTLWAGHPDCALSSLRGLPLALWSDHDVLLVVCLTLLVRSAGFARIEEANGTELTLDHVAHLLERCRRTYNSVPGRPAVPPVRLTRDLEGGPSVTALDELATSLRERRAALGSQVVLYRVIHGALMHKVEHLAGPAGTDVSHRIDTVVARMTEHLPLHGSDLTELGESLSETPDWLAAPHAAFGTGLEALVHRAVSACTEAFDADFAMSRGLRSLPALVTALREQDWAEITSWEINRYYCCVVAGPDAARHFGGSLARVADMAWAMSSRMQYNSWHFIAGNLPREPVVTARDHFVPPTIPDLAYFSDQHHHGHVTAKVRFSIRSPYSAMVLGRRFNGFIDLRLLRCAGRPFTEADLLAARRVSAFVGHATGLVADLVARGANPRVTSFDSPWHWATITGSGITGPGAGAPGGVGGA